MRLSKKDKKLIIDSVNNSINEYLLNHMPQLITNAPDTWQNDEKEIYDHFASLEMIIIDNIKKEIDFKE